jgi:hypothetical protein
MKTVHAYSDPYNKSRIRLQLTSCRCRLPMTHAHVLALPLVENLGSHRILDSSARSRDRSYVNLTVICAWVAQCEI